MTEIPKGSSFSIEPMPAEMEAKFMDGARQSGFVDRHCERCTRWYMSREDSPLCPPCRHGKPDSWCPALSVRKAITGSPVADPLLVSCAFCAGLGVVGWKPYGPHEPRCPCCGGCGQL